MVWQRKPRSADYGGSWKTTRAQWAARHRPTDPCVRCGHPLGPMGPGLHLDHDDHDRRIIRGFAHARCNVRAGARKASAIAHARQRAARLGSSTLRW